MVDKGEDLSIMLSANYNKPLTITLLFNFSEIISQIYKLYIYMFTKPRDVQFF